MARHSFLPAFAVLLLTSSPVIGQTTSGTSSTIVVPIVAQTVSFGSEVTVYNPNGVPITVRRPD